MAGDAWRTTQEIEGVPCADPDAGLSSDADILDVCPCRCLLEDRRAGGTLVFEEEQAGIAEPVATVAGIDALWALATRQEQAEGHLAERDRRAQRLAWRQLREPVDERHRGAAQVEEPQQRRARPGYDECDSKRGDAGGQGEDEDAAAPSAAGQASAHCTGQGRRGGQVEARREIAELELEFRHRSSSCSRASARCALDFTVPRAMPSAAAVSSSESSRK